MEITQQIRDYAAKHTLGPEAALEAGRAEKSETFKETGGEIYS